MATLLLITCRLASCGRRFLLCSRCYRGQRYCSRACSTQARLASVRAARRTYRSHPAVTIAVRMDSSNTAPLDYYLIPSLDVHADRLRVGADNFVGIDAYRFDNLDFFVGWPSASRSRWRREPRQEHPDSEDPRPQPARTEQAEARGDRHERLEGEPQEAHHGLPAQSSLTAP